MNAMPTTALTNAPSRKIFAPMFRARWQNMQNIVTDSVIVSLVPAQYATYYSAYIVQWLQWARGFVPQLHRQDFFSTGVGTMICDLFAKECMSGGYRLESEDAETKSFAENWCKDDLNNVLNKMFWLANAGGNAILVLTPVDGALYPAVYPVDRAFFVVGRTGAITDIMILNRFVAGELSYYAKEIRTVRNGKPYWRVELSDGTIATSPTWGNVPLERMPEAVVTQWKYCYGDILPGVWYEMPERMRNIGCYNVKNKAVASAIMDMPGYSDSTLHTALDILYSIDYNYTQAQVDQYLGRGRVLVPKQFDRPSRITLASGEVITMCDGRTFQEALETVPEKLEDTFFTQVGDGSVEGKDSAPTFIQPGLRGDERKLIRDGDLEFLAAKVGLSASSLASHLAGGGSAKTDDEINAEQSTTEKSVGNKRQLAARAINAMLNDVAYFYGLPGKIEIQWGRSTGNSARENTELMSDYQAHTLSLLDYIKMRYPDLTEEAAKQRAEDAEAYWKQKEEVPYNDSDYFKSSEEESAEPSDYCNGNGRGTDTEGGI